MKKLIFASLCLSFIIYIGSCVKSSQPGYTTCTGPKPADDSTALLTFARANGITPTLDSTGLYYQIIDSGAGARPTLSSRISVTYVGKLMSGYTFDSVANAANTNFLLSNLIQGWQIGIPKIMKGGHIKLLIPSAYGYGCTGSSSGIVPANAPLYYDVQLVDVQ
jgi:FKBP-type peptidyl-prolyl cis-trans isomerase FkpA